MQTILLQRYRSTAYWETKVSGGFEGALLLMTQAPDKVRLRAFPQSANVYVVFVISQRAGLKSRLMPEHKKLEWRYVQSSSR